MASVLLQLKFPQLGHKQYTIQWSKSSCGMLRYKPTLSMVHKLMSSRKFGKEWKFFKKLLESSIF